jgi:hypothetical protein
MHPLLLIRRYAGQSGIGGTLRHSNHNEISEPLEQIFYKPRRWMPRGDDVVNHTEQRSTIVRRDSVHSIVEQCPVGEPEEADSKVIGHPSLGGTRDELVQHGQ